MGFFSFVTDAIESVHNSISNAFDSIKDAFDFRSADVPYSDVRVSKVSEEAYNVWFITADDTIYRDYEKIFKKYPK